MQVPELKTAFRKLAVQYHPDKALAGCAAQCSLGGTVMAAQNEGLHGRLRTSANELFQLVNEAWETLQNPSKRQMCRIEHDEGAPADSVALHVFDGCILTLVLVLAWRMLHGLAACLPITTSCLRQLLKPCVFQCCCNVELPDV